MTLQAARPTPLPIRADRIPQELRLLRRWVGWRYVWRNGKWTKPPVIATAPDRHAKSTDPSTWCSFDEALAAYEDGKIDGIGFVLGDGYVGYDRDKSKDLSTGRILNSYGEWSPGGEGFHVLCRGVKPDGTCRSGNDEMYSQARYFTITGHHIEGFPTTIEERTPELAVLHAQLFGKAPEQAATADTGSVEENDDSLIAKAKAAKNAAKFIELWEGRGDSDKSRATSALVWMLAFWTKGDASRIDRLFRRSGLMRAKWDEKRGSSTWGADIVSKAVAQYRTKTARESSIPLDDVPHPADSNYSRALPEAKVKLTYANTIPPRPVRWLWRDRLPLGTLSLLAGREGIGKTTFAYALIADLTNGTLDGAFKGEPRTVIVAAAEDSWEHTIVPRLMAHGADLSRVARIDVVTPEGIDTMLTLPRDITALADVIKEAGAVLLLLDPLISRLSSKLDTHKDADVRVGLEPLVHLAEVAGIVLLGIIHVNKGHSKDPLNMIMGSRAFTAVSRAVLFVAEDPEAEDEGGRVVGQAKNNLGRSDLPMIGFTIEDAIVGNTPDGDIHTGRVRLTGESDRSIRDVVEEAAKGRTSEATAWKEAMEWLKSFLDYHKGVADSREIKTAGAAQGHSESALKRALKELKGTTRPTKTKPPRSLWLLPGANADMLHLHPDDQPFEEPRGKETSIEM